MNPAQRVSGSDDRDRMRRRVRAITTGTVAGAAVGAIALTTALSGNAAAGGEPSVTSGSTSDNSGQVTEPLDAGSGAGIPDDSSSSGDQLVPAQQPPQFGGGGRSNAGSGGS